jgi:hypothetical protein
MNQLHNRHHIKLLALKLGKLIACKFPASFMQHVRVSSVSIYLWICARERRSNRLQHPLYVNFLGPVYFVKETLKREREKKKQNRRKKETETETETERGVLSSDATVPIKNTQQEGGCGELGACWE